MPLFDYQCENCGKVIEWLVKDVSDRPHGWGQFQSRWLE